jgi:hypothetical protein
VFINEKYFYLGLRGKVEDQFNPKNKFVVHTISDIYTIACLLHVALYPISVAGHHFNHVYSNNSIFNNHPYFSLRVH